jgi:hypothetical protein
MFWILTALTGFLLSIQAAKQCHLQKASVHFYMMLTFIVFGTGFGYIAYLFGAGKSVYLLDSVWTLITIIVGLLLIPVFYKHFFILVGDRGGICLEGGFLGMILGFMLITTHAYHILPFIGMIILASFFFGYVRLQNLLLYRIK